MRRIHHFYGQLVALGQGKESGCGVHEIVQQLCIDTVPGHIEKADVVGGRSQLRQKCGTLSIPSVEPA
jgi:hypothetical protein